MSNYLKEYILKKPLKKIKYLEGEPLKLTEELTFFHNKSKLRKELSRLQYLFKSYTNNPLLALGIRDSYLNEEYTDKYLILLFTTKQILEKTNQIIEQHLDLEIGDKCYYIKSNTDYLLLLTRDLSGYNEGIDIIEEILKQSLEHYFETKEFEDFIKIPPFVIYDCMRE
ncbi:MAG: hypothetical protein ACFE8N_00495 [Promethearchaeota archaeon]